jgi:hypothetical protein
LQNKRKPDKKGVGHCAHFISSPSGLALGSAPPFLRKTYVRQKENAS